MLNQIPIHQPEGLDKHPFEEAGDVPQRSLLGLVLDQVAEVVGQLIGAGQALKQRQRLAAAEPDHNLVLIQPEV
ncbi:MAG: hypothetical protein WA890_12630 [Micromonospora sp.]